MVEVLEEAKVRKYQVILNKFMSYQNNTTYTSTHRFEDEELLRITSEELCKYFCKKIFGVKEPGPAARPTLGRSASVEYWKKAISYFMPMRLDLWNKQAKEGNLTGSVEVNLLSKKINKFEAWKQGLFQKHVVH